MLRSPFLSLFSPDQNEMQHIDKLPEGCDFKVLKTILETDDFFLYKIECRKLPELNTLKEFKTNYIKRSIITPVQPIQAIPNKNYFLRPVYFSENSKTESPQLFYSISEKSILLSSILENYCQGNVDSSNEPDSDERLNFSHVYETELTEEQIGKIIVSLSSALLFMGNLKYSFFENYVLYPSSILVNENFNIQLMNLEIKNQSPLFQNDRLFQANKLNNIIQSFGIICYWLIMS